MKKMKKSLLTLLTAILIGSTFTSCVENTIPDEVVAIYDGQANLLAAQAALLAAEANAANAAAALTAAQTAHEQTKAAALAAATAISQANNAAALAQAEADLANSIAQNAADLADQQAALAARTAKFAADAAKAQAELDVMIAMNARAAALAAEQLAALIAANDNTNATAIETLKALIAQNAIDAANAEEELAATIAQNAIDAAHAQEELAATIAQNAIELAEAQEELATMSALNALELARQEAAIDAILAQAVIDAETAILTLELAQATHDLNLATLLDQIAALDDTLLAAHFANFSAYSTLLNNAQTAEVTAQLAILTQIHLMATAVQTDEATIAGFNNALNIAEATKADLEGQQAALSASIAAGTTIADKVAIVDGLQAEIDANVILIETLTIDLAAMATDIAAQTAAVNATTLALGLTTLDIQFNTAKDNYNDAVDAVAITTAAITDQTADIATIQDIIDTYDATTTTFEEAVALAEAAKAAADDAKTAANQAAEDALAVFIAEAANKVVQMAELVVIQGDNAVKQVAVNAAAVAWQLAKDNRDNSVTQNAVDAAVAAVLVAQDAYDVARDNFDDQSGEYTWSGGLNGVIGIQPDGPTADRVDTYIVVASITESGVAPDVTYTATYGEPTTENVTAGGAPMDPEAVDATTATGDYFEYGSDDESTNDLAEFQAATTELDNKKADLDIANVNNVTDHDAAVADAQEEYEAKVFIFENAETLLANQLAVVDAANTATAAADDARLDAIDDEDTADDAVTDAITAVTDAGTDLAIHLGTTVLGYESNIEDLEVIIAQLNIDIVDENTAVETTEAIKDALRAQLDAGKPADLIAAELALDAATILRDAALATRTILTNSNTNKEATILLFDLTERDDILGFIAALDVNIATADTAIAAAQANIDGFADLTIAQRIELSQQALVALEAGLVIIQGDVALFAQLKAKYEALVNSLL